MRLLMKTKTTIEKMYQTILDKNNENGDSDDFYLAGMIDILDWALHSDVSDILFYFFSSFRKDITIKNSIS